MNLTWATGQSLGDIGGARLGEAAGDEVAYLLLSAICVAAFLVLRSRPIRQPATAFALRALMPGAAGPGRIGSATAVSACPASSAQAFARVELADRRAAFRCSCASTSR